MNDLSSRVESQGSTAQTEATSAASPSVAEMVRRAESVRTTLVFASVALVIALTVVVQSSAARRAAEQRPVAASGSGPARQGAAEAPEAASNAAKVSPGVSR